MGNGTTIKWMRARFASKCKGCGDELYEDDLIAYDYSEKVAYCKDCGEIEEENQEARNATPRSRRRYDDIDEFEDCD